IPPTSTRLTLPMTEYYTIVTFLKRVPDTVSLCQLAIDVGVLPLLLKYTHRAPGVNPLLYRSGSNFRTPSAGSLTSESHGLQGRDTARGHRYYLSFGSWLCNFFRRSTRGWSGCETNPQRWMFVTRPVET